MIQKTLVFCISLALMISCGSTPKEATHDHKHDEAHDHGHDHDHGAPRTAEDVPDDGVSTVTLNNGAKWKANQETTDGIAQMQRLIEGFTDIEDVEAYESLKSDLTNEFSLIFENCTMTGEAHNQLHHFLLPMQEMFDNLVSGDLETQKQTLHDLDERLKTYETFFE